MTTPLAYPNVSEVFIGVEQFQQISINTATGAEDKFYIMTFLDETDSDGV